MWQTAIYSAKWSVTGLAAIVLAVELVVWFRVLWWKVVVAALPAAILALLFPHEPMIPFAAAVLGLSTITSTNTGESGEWFSTSWGRGGQTDFAPAVVRRVGRRGVARTYWT